MEWIGAATLLVVSAALATMLCWSAWRYEQPAGLWWAAAGLVIGLDGVITRASGPEFLMPYTTGAVGPTAAWLFYRGACAYADRPPRVIAAVLAFAVTGVWFALHFRGPPGWPFYASPVAELPLMATSAFLITRAVESTMSRFFAASCAVPVLLVALNPFFKDAGLSAPLMAQIWLAALCPICIFAVCVFMDRGLEKTNAVLGERSEQLQRYRDHLEDLVEQRTAELDASQRRLRHNERLASIGTLTAGIAHQVNNPVGSIMAAAGFARSCRGDAEELETLRRAVSDIEAEASRCGEIVRDMLQFASDRPADKKEIPVDSVIERVRNALRRIARERRATIEVVLDGPSPNVNASSIELEQALANVVENALQSRPEAARVRIERTASDSEIRIEVHDDGLGIPADTLEHVFDPFFTSRLDAGGTGLGLSVAHGIVVEHGGRTEVESRLDEGTTVVITLPRAA